MAEQGAPSGARPRLWLLRRILPLLLVLLAAIWFFRGSPREVTLTVNLSGKREGLQAVRLELRRLPDRALARHVELFYSAASPAPAQLRLPTRLSPGDYEADLTLAYAARSERAVRRFKLERQEEIPLEPP